MSDDNNGHRIDNVHLFPRRAAEADLTQATDEALMEGLERELTSTTLGPIELRLRPETMFQLVGLVQLATRHPEMAENSSVLRVARGIVKAGQGYFVDCPTVLEILRRGDDPERDHPW